MRNVDQNLLQGQECQDWQKDIIARVKNGDIGQLQLVEIECDKWDIINC